MCVDWILFILDRHQVSFYIFFDPTVEPHDLGVDRLTEVFFSLREDDTYYLSVFHCEAIGHVLCFVQQSSSESVKQHLYLQLWCE